MVHKNANATFSFERINVSLLWHSDELQPSCFRSHLLAETRSSCIMHHVPSLDLSDTSFSSCLHSRPSKLAYSKPGLCWQMRWNRGGGKGSPTPAQTPGTSNWRRCVNRNLRVA